MDSLLAQGRRLLDTGFAAEALPFLERAHDAARRDADAALWLAEAQRLLNRHDDAQHTLEAGTAAAPERSDLAVARSALALGRGDIAEARDILAGMPVADAPVLVQQARVEMAARDHLAAMDILRRCLAFEPGHLAAQSALIVATAHDARTDTAALKALQRDLTWPAPLPADWPLEPFEPRRKLRVGYVSRAFNRNNVSKIIAAALLHHDPERVEVTLYATGRLRDDASLRFRRAASRWRAIARLSDREAVAQIRRDRIDILVDIDGHFFANRLGIFCLRAAPVQISAWGYVPGPGVPGIDAILTDNVAVPPHEAALFAERLLPLSHIQPYDGTFRPRDVHAVAPRPDGAIRFGSFHRSDKLNDDVLALWARILAAIPGATLLLKSKYFDHGAQRDPVLGIFAAADIDPTRILFESGAPHADYLAAFDRIDIALDPFPVNGGLVTLDGLTQGVPAITLTGNAPSARIGASILSHLRLERFICRSTGAYVACATALAADTGSLDALRREVRTKANKAFGMTAGRHYAAEVESAYREAWVRRISRS